VNISIIIVISNQFYCAQHKKNTRALQLSTVTPKAKPLIIIIIISSSSMMMMMMKMMLMMLVYYHFVNKDIR